MADSTNNLIVEDSSSSLNKVELLRKNEHLEGLTMQLKNQLEISKTVIEDLEDQRLRLTQITLKELKIRNEKLNSENKKFIGVFNNSTDEIYIIDPDSLKILEVNNTACEALGFLYRELRGMKITSITTTKALFEKEFKKITRLTSGGDTCLEAFHKRKDGSNYPIDLSIKTMDFGGKKIILGVARDISSKKKAAEVLKEQYQESLEFQSMLLGSQMNPHFIFNSLSSIQFHILNEDKESAIKYVSDFAALMRTTLDNSRKKEISLESEIIYLKQYLKIEKERCLGNFNYTIHIDNRISIDETYIPPMLIQPHVENSILHGLAMRHGIGQVKIYFSLVADDKIKCIVEDNGIGRAKSKQLNKFKENHKSSGLEITERRMELLDIIYKDVFKINTIDTQDEKGNLTGTRVEFTIPRMVD